ncbi:MAG: metallophosphoesterase family protein [Anaerolineae bacterium]|jgi:hypothetical protein|nr:metallophosphoesterase family protein [Anaerolineae bacterium]
MTTFIALPDLHDKSDHVKRIARPLHEADAVLLPGDMTNGSNHQLLRLFTLLDELNEQQYAVPGNMDTAAMLAYLAREGLNLHRTWQMLDDVALCGVGGALPFAGDFVFSEAQLAGLLQDCIAGVPERVPLVLVCHQPPLHTACDRLGNGQHVGSAAVRAFIERVQPLVCFTGHIHEAQAIDHVGRTAIINPGPLWHSQAYAFAEITGGTLVTLAIRPVQPHDAGVALTQPGGPSGG